jgi:hypothetical protein
MNPNQQPSCVAPQDPVIPLGMVVKILEIVDLSLHTCARYYATWFGLARECSEGSRDLKDVREVLCGDFCSNIDYMKNAGVVMQILGAFAIISTLSELRLCMQFAACLSAD